MKGKGEVESRGSADGLLVACGVGCLFSFNVLLCVMLSFVRYRFGGDLAVNDEGMLACQVASLVVTAALTFVRSSEVLFAGLVAGAVCNAAGTGLIIGSESRGLFIAALGLIGCGMSCIQGCGFAVLAHPALEPYAGAPRFSLGQGLGGLIAWILGLLFDRVFKEPAADAMPVAAACALLIVACGCTVVPSCGFVAFFRLKLQDATVPPTLPNSREPLYPGDHQNGDHQNGDHQNHNSLSGEHNPLNGDYVPMAADGTGLLPIVPYVFGIYMAFVVTLFSFPGVAPLRWNIGDKVIWLIGVFQVGDIVGRFLGGWSQPMASALFVCLSCTRLPLVYWCLAALGQSLASKVVCMAILAASNSYLFTVGMSQSPPKITPSLRASAASCCILGLLLGNATGLWACGRFADRLLQIANRSDF
ncbi:nucleoside transporter [Gregarina niphandrodes]|uniref:Nucleoside transporter n=1 Tax=Gregarina niphandrodes TaxID=110365 RepID=A0A023B8H7_GRENI|nr:nucleoside transporter [Gregarina niphandrodes]EZG69141.1 nucleoside transporter [Gregarina niphandrodes]|eukprot:XP_011134472.1 nucleoside transporter [Gregarina niphandrodes]